MNADALRRNPLVIIVMITFKENQHRIVKEMHQYSIGGYQGVQRTYDRLKLYVTWIGMFYDVQDYISKCKLW